MTNKIYKNQIEAANLLVQAVKNGHKVLLLIAEPQSGKTGVMINFCYQLKKEYHNVAPVNIFIPGDISLKEQTDMRFNEEYENEKGQTIKLTSGLTKIWYPNILCTEKQENIFLEEYKNRKKDVKNDSGILINIHDESHRDISKESVFSKIFEMCNIPLITKINEEYEKLKEKIINKNDSEVTLLCTATPGPQIEFAKKYFEEYKELPFAIVYLKADSSYIGLESLYKANRIKQSIKIVDKKNEEFHKNMIMFNDNIMNDFLNEIPGYGIIRLSPNDNKKYFEKIKKELKEFAKSKNKNLEVNSFTCEQGNIQELQNIISHPTKIHQICVIINSYLQGKTFNNLSNVRFWHDTFDKYGNNDTFVAQSIGRNCGYYDPKINYPVFSDISTINRLINFYNTIKEVNNKPELISDIPSLTGTFIKLKNKRKINDNYEWEIIFHNNLQERNEDKELEKLLNFYPGKLTDGRNTEKSLSENIIENIINENFKHLGGSREIKALKDHGIKTDLICGTIYLKDPTNKKDYPQQFKDSYKKYIFEKKDSLIYQKQNMYMTYVGKKSEASLSEKDNAFDTGSMYSMYEVSNSINEETTNEETTNEVQSKYCSNNFLKNILNKPKRGSREKINIEFHIKNNQNYFKTNISSKKLSEIYIDILKNIFNFLILSNQKDLIDKIISNNSNYFSNKKNSIFRKSGEVIKEKNILLNNNFEIYANTNNCNGKKLRILEDLIFDEITKADNTYEIKIL